MRDLVLAGLRQRLGTFEATGDLKAITGFDSDLELSALLGPNSGTDLEAFTVAGMIYWHRYRAGQREALSTALRLLGAAYTLDAASIPRPLRLILDCRA